MQNLKKDHTTAAEIPRKQRRIVQRRVPSVVNIRNEAYQKFTQRRARETPKIKRVKRKVTGKIYRCRKRKYENDKLQKIRFQGR